VEVERSAIQFVCDSAPGIVCPELFPCDLNTGNAVWPFGFQMDRLDVLSVSSEEEIVFVAGQVFWHLAVFHGIGVVHNDFKPSNILLSNAHAFLCYFGNASKWSIGQLMMDVCGAT
jgi:serine/threonine protein kinase